MTPEELTKDSYAGVGVLFVVLPVCRTTSLLSINDGAFFCLELCVFLVFSISFIEWWCINLSLAFLVQNQAHRKKKKAKSSNSFPTVSFPHHLFTYFRQGFDTFYFFFLFFVFEGWWYRFCWKPLVFWVTMASMHGVDVNLSLFSIIAIHLAWSRIPSVVFWFGWELRHETSQAYSWLKHGVRNTKLVVLVWTNLGKVSVIVVRPR